MPEDKNAKTVDIDTSGPEMDVEIKDDSTPEPEFEVKEETVKEVREEATSPDASDTKLETGDKKTETKKDELEDYSEGVQRRIAKLTKKMREAERQKEEALRYAEILKVEKDATLKRYSVLEDVSVKDREARISSGLQAAQAKLAAAREAQDLSAEVDAQKEIAKLGYEEARLMDAKAQLEFAPRNQIQNQPRPEINLGRSNEQTFRPDSKAEAWGSKNKWFGQDAVMTYTAFDIHKKLVEDEGYDAASDEYYAEIDKRIRLELPHKFDKIATTETTKPVQVVASAKRSTKPGRKTVRLTPSQVAIAKKLGVPLEEYAKQLNITKEV
jgi:hypothetical protein